MDMPNESNSTHHKRDTSHIPVGMRLKSAREAKGMDTKHIASQMRLNEKIILMLESEVYSSDIPELYIRGYLRSYGKLLGIADQEILKGIEPIKAKPVTQHFEPIVIHTLPVTSKNYFMQIFTGLIILTIIGLAGIWWHSNSQTILNKIKATPNKVNDTPVIPVVPEIPEAPAYPNTAPQETVVIDNTATNVNDPPTPIKQEVIPAPAVPEHGFSALDSNAADIQAIVKQKAKTRKHTKRIPVPLIETYGTDENANTDTMTTSSTDAD